MSHVSKTKELSPKCILAGIREFPGQGKLDLPGRLPGHGDLSSLADLPGQGKLPSHGEPLPTATGAAMPGVATANAAVPNPKDTPGSSTGLSLG